MFSGIWCTLLLLCQLAASNYVDIAPTNVYPTWQGGSYIDYQKGLDYVFNHYTSPTPISQMSPEWSMFPLIAGISIVDINKDGWPDFYIVNAENHPNRLYINLGLDEDGHPIFEDQADLWNLVLLEHGSSTPIFVDFDNDGDQDVVVGSYNMSQSALLLLNNGSSFVDVTAGSGLEATVNYTCTSPVVADFNLDGWLDIYFSNTFNNTHKHPIYIGNDPSKQENLYFLNNGTSGLSFHPGPAINESNRVTWAAMAVDFNEDGYVDIIHANDQAAVPPFPASFQQGIMVALKNLGNGTLIDVSNQVGFSSPNPFQNVPNLGAWMSADVGDLNCDGLLDVSATNLGGIPARYLSSGLVSCAARTTTWFMQQANGTFKNTFADGMNMPFGWGGVMPDIDNDGDRDQCFVGGMGDGMYPTMAILAPITCIQNIGYCTGEFTRRTDWEPADLRFRDNDHPLAIADFNRDRKIDMITASEDHIPEDQALVTYDPLGCTGPYVNDNKWTKGPVIWTNEGQNNCSTFNRTNCLVLPDPSKVADPGTLAVYINHVDDSNNNAISIALVGGFGIVPGSIVNRDGIGAVVHVTPRNLPGNKDAVGKKVKIPLAAGNSFASQSSKELHFGLGQYKEADIDVLWPGNVYNALYKVPANTDQIIHEVPCDTHTVASQGALITCLNSALDYYKNAGYSILGPHRSWMIASFREAYDRNH